MDDDPSVLQLWKVKTRDLSGVETVFLPSAEGIGPMPWRSDAALIIDQHLGGPKKGIEILAGLGLKNHGYLCTSEYDDPAIQGEVRRLGVYLIPKPCIETFKFGDKK